MIRQSISVSRPNRLANRKASPFSKQSLAHAARVMAPTLFALTFASVAHAQGTMDFSGAQTLMGTFNNRLAYVAISRASEDVRVYTNDAAILGEKLASDITKSVALPDRIVKGGPEITQSTPTGAVDQLELTGFELGL